MNTEEASQMAEYKELTLLQTLSFFRSVILSGEQWSGTCQRAYDRAKEQIMSSALPDDIRAAGWSVAVHNDYRHLQEPYTFWLFTKNGSAVKGEGRTDAEALDQVRRVIAEARFSGL